MGYSEEEALKLWITIQKENRDRRAANRARSGSWSEQVGDNQVANSHNLTNPTVDNAAANKEQSITANTGHADNEANGRAPSSSSLDSYEGIQLFTKSSDVSSNLGHKNNYKAAYSQGNTQPAGVSQSLDSGSSHNPEVEREIF